MLNFFRRLVRNRKRLIFRYWDGSKLRRGDPLEIYRALMDHPVFNWSVHPVLIDVEDDEKTSLEATAITAQAVRDAFRVRPLDNGGLCQSECVSLLAEFTLWVEDVKKKLSPSPMPRPSMAPPSSPPSGRSATSSPSASGSTPTAAKSGDPPPCSPVSPATSTASPATGGRL